MKDSHNEKKESQSKSHIVGLGASAGGLEALELFFNNLPKVEDFSFVIIQHLSPDYKSLMGEILARHTKIPIHEAEVGMPVEPGNIYINPRKSNMTIFNGRLLLREQEHGLNLPIDIFFHSLAEDLGEKAIGIIFSGTGSDGTRGVRDIKEAGGIVMVQSPETAKFDGMPSSAVATGIVDFVLPPDEMPKALISYVSGNRKLASTLKHDKLADATGMSKILSLIRARTGVDFSFYKQNTVVRRIQRRMGINQVQTLDQYVRFLENYPGEIQTLYKEILIGVTKFFRDPEAFDVIKQKVLPRLYENKEAQDSVRVWVAGCSTGEEAYSLAILIAEYCEEMGLQDNIKIFATDIDRDALEFASTGIYSESIAADASMGRLRKYFVPKGDNYQIMTYIRERVIFAHHNIIKDPPFSKIDLITCRNLLIYLQPVLQKKVLQNFHFSLNTKGFLFLGSSETVGDSGKLFTPEDIKWKIYQRVGEGRIVGNIQEVSHDNRWSRYSQKILPVPNLSTRLAGEVENVFDSLVRDYVPPSVMVNENKEVLHTFGNINEYLRLPSGKMDTDVTKMARDELSIPLGTALQQAIKKRQNVHYSNVVVMDKGQNKKKDINLKINKVDGDSNSSNFIIIFEPMIQGECLDESAEKYDLEENVRKRINDLEQELQYTKENLQATIEELETSNEELQATNEELLAANEELQSTNEELQSVNEELITVNSEYQAKISELTELNEDMDNLLENMDIGILFLDDSLVIRKFTQPVTQAVNIIKNDVGRPLEHLSHRMLNYQDFFSDVRRVLYSEEVFSAEAETSEGQHFLIKVTPYLTAEKLVQGVVISFVDISDKIATQKALERERKVVSSILSSAPIAVTMVDTLGRITYANKEATELFGFQFDDLNKMKYDDPGFTITDLDGNPVPSEDLPFSRVVHKGQKVKDYAHKIVTRNQEEKILLITGNPLYDEDENTISGAVFTLEYLTTLACPWCASC